ncbi:Uncharacterised protein [Mycobacteroides abscessus subsp. abscessus]|nr:Uncharacterised protein [Mycobacteroides abscessus subsp. abscessus]
MLPASGSAYRVSILVTVVLPDPDGPTRAVSERAGAVNDTPRSTGAPSG